MKDAIPVVVAAIVCLMHEEYFSSLYSLIAMLAELTHTIRNNNATIFILLTFFGGLCLRKNFFKGNNPNWLYTYNYTIFYVDTQVYNFAQNYCRYLELISEVYYNIGYLKKRFNYIIFNCYYWFHGYQERRRAMNEKKISPFTLDDRCLIFSIICVAIFVVLYAIYIITTITPCNISHIETRTYQVVHVGENVSDYSDYGIAMYYTYETEDATMYHFEFVTESNDVELVDIPANVVTINYINFNEKEYINVISTYECSGYNKNTAVHKVETCKKSIPDSYQLFIHKET